MKYNHEYNIIEKKIRAEVIAEHISESESVVCFTCGNAAKALIKEGVKTLAIIRPEKWYTVSEIHRKYPGKFDATSGHLPWPLMMEIACRLCLTQAQPPAEIYLPTGSGETLVCMKLAWPQTKITAVYNLDHSTEYQRLAPLNCLVETLAEKIVYIPE